MKPETIKVLNDAVQWLSNAEQNAYTKNALDCIHRAVALDAPAPTGKFDIWRWVMADELRPQMACIYHENGKRIASNSYILVVLTNQDYDPKFEGQMVRKDGVILEYDKYPKYESVRLKSEYLNKSARVDFSKVAAAMKQLRAYRKLTDKKAMGVAKIGGAWFDLTEFARFITFLQYKGLDEIKTQQDGKYERAWLAEHEDGSWAIIMPLYKGCDEDKCENKYFFDVELNADKQ